MADFCQQCSIEMWGQDSGDLASLGYAAVDVHLYTICEGCGLTVVNKVGQCIGDCLLHHGTLSVQTMQEFVDAKLPKNR